VMGADCWHGYEHVECPWCSHLHDDEGDELYEDREDDDREDDE